MIYLLIDMMYHKKYKHIWSLFAVMCLFKHQGAYFIFPILLYTCILKIDIYKKIKGFMMGLCIGIMGWLPFIWLYKDILYPIRFMLHMMSENSVISMAINPWFLIQVIRLYETDVLFKFANVFILLCVLLLLITYIKSKDIVISTYIYMLSIYMFSLGQRERYILYSLIIAYYVCYIIRDTSYLKIYKAFRVSAIISLSFFLINTISPKDVAYYSLYIILPLYFLLAVWLLIKTALASTSYLCIIPAADYLRLLSEGRINTPGTEMGNWQWRMKKDAFSEEKKRNMKDFLYCYGRTR